MLKLDWIKEKINVSLPKKNFKHLGRFIIEL